MTALVGGPIRNVDTPLVLSIPVIVPALPRTSFQFQSVAYIPNGTRSLWLAPLSPIYQSGVSYPLPGQESLPTANPLPIIIVTQDGINYSPTFMLPAANESGVIPYYAYLMPPYQLAGSKLTQKGTPFFITLDVVELDSSTMNANFTLGLYGSPDVLEPCMQGGIPS